MSRFPLPFFVLALLAIFQVSPARLGAWRLKAASTGESMLVRQSGLTHGEAIFPSPPLDLDGDERPENIQILNGKVLITSGNSGVWTSPGEWQVRQAAFTDLNNDGQGEVSLLVWRAFRPWPVDEFLPSGGRIQDFQNADGQSCHLILIGWFEGEYQELWAGSALSAPIYAFAAADLLPGGGQELAVLEGNYEDKPGAAARALSVWEWNGFGFTILARENGNFSGLGVVDTVEGNLLVLAQQ